MSTETRGETTIERVGLRLADFVENWMPSPFLFAIILTYIVYVAALVVEGAGLGEAVGFWYDGFWNFLSFAMQMTLILMTGFVIAYHPWVNGVLRRLAKVPSNGRQAVLLVGVVAMALAWIHWGLSLILGAIFAREMGRTAHENGIQVHYPLLCVAGYMGLGLTWHWGLSASAPLLLNTPGNDFIEAGVIDSVVPASATIFSSYALVLTVLAIGYAALVLYLLSPSPENARGIDAYLSDTELAQTATDGGERERSDGGAETVSEPEPVPAERIDNSRLLGGLIALTGVGVVGYSLVTQGLDTWNLNLVNFAFLMVGLAIYTRPQLYRERFGEAAEAAAGIILLFPFFAGIEGIMASSGLATTIAESLLAISTVETFPIIAWLTAGVVNMFVPSGGGEWIVLGPSLVEAADQLGVPVGKATIAYAVGDAHTNLFNPFWAIPLLAITRIKAREMFGYAIAMLLALIPFLAVALYVVPY
jgi:short-chain fatty acids transporter